MKANKELIQNSNDLALLSESSIKKFAVDNKLDKKPVKTDDKTQNPEEIFVQKPVEADKENSFLKYTKLFKEHPLFNEYGQLMMMSPPVVILIFL